MTIVSVTVRPPPPGGSGLRMPFSALSGVEPHHIGHQSAQLIVRNAVGIGDRRAEHLGGARQRFGRAIEHLR